MENHHFSWENSLFLWWFSIVMLVITRGYLVHINKNMDVISQSWANLVFGPANSHPPTVDQQQQRSRRQLGTLIRPEAKHKMFWINLKSTVGMHLKKNPPSVCYWCLVGNGWVAGGMGWLLIVSQWIIPENSLRLAPVRFDVLILQFFS